MVYWRQEGTSLTMQDLAFRNSGDKNTQDTVQIAGVGKREITADEL